MINVNTESKRLQVRKKKNIIYVDASSFNGRFKIGLYDKNRKRKHTLKLGKAIKHIHIAEQYAILYGLMYIQKRNTTKKYILMNDCESAVSDDALMNLSIRINTRLLWIPREINKADKIAKSKVNKKKKVWHGLHFLMSVLSPDKVLLQEEKKYALITEKVLSPIVKIIYQKIQNERNSFPMTTADFSQMVTSVYNDEDVEMKKGTSLRARKELSDNKIIRVANKVVTLITED